MLALGAWLVVVAELGRPLGGFVFELLDDFFFELLRLRIGFSTGETRSSLGLSDESRVPLPLRGLAVRSSAP
eukprot:COSAG05_NODE_4745_length_1388_cov_1.541505_3_plen_71_part_01